MKQEEPIAKARGLRILGQGMEDQLEGLSQYVVLPSEEGLSKAAADRSKEPGIAILDNRELMGWHVARHAYEPHLKEIKHCLTQVSIESACSTEEWLPALEQLLPLEAKLSANSLEQLQKAALGDVSTLRIYEQHICTHFLAIPGLALRMKLLCAVRDMKTERDRLRKAIATAKAAYEAPVDTSKGEAKLRGDIRDFLAALTYLTKRDNLAGIAQSVQVGHGKQLLRSAWRAGEAGHELCKAQSFLDALEPALLGDSQVTSIADVCQRAMERKKESDALVLSAHGSSEQLVALAMYLAAAVTALEAELGDALLQGQLLLQSLHQLPRDTPAPGSWNERLLLARDLDSCMKSFRHLLQNLLQAKDTEQSQRTHLSSPIKETQRTRKPRPRARRMAWALLRDVYCRVAETRPEEVESEPTDSEFGDARSVIAEH